MSGILPFASLIISVSCKELYVFTGSDGYCCHGILSCHGIDPCLGRNQILQTAMLEQ
jgi:hypothetical protein